jgi:hypothetical protein
VRILNPQTLCGHGNLHGRQAMLEILEAGLRAADPYANTLALVRDKQDAHGRWPLEYDYAGKTWVDFGPKKQPNKWVTLRALRVLKAAG